MKITVLGGSPKGEISVTMQYVNYLKLNYPEHEFVIHQPALTVRKLEEDKAAFEAIMGDIKSSQAVLWAFPLYVFTVCSQYQRFIELITERGAEGAFAGKYAATLSTSINFFDHTAHRHMREVCDNLGMNFCGSYSAHMNDLTSAAKRKSLLIFFDDMISADAEGRKIPAIYEKLPPYQSVYAPGAPVAGKAAAGMRITVVADTMQGNTGAMASRFMDSFAEKPLLADLSKLDMKGGCLGCLKCGQKNICQYTGKDAYIPMYEEALKKADIIIFCLTMKGRALSSRFKMFLDRSFYNTHQRSLSGKQIAFMISGPFSKAENQREIVNAYAEWQLANLADIITDEHPESLDMQIDSLAKRIIGYAQKRYLKPATFLGVGGMKVFRDDVYSELRVVFKGDHRAYKKGGLYNFPQNKPFAQLGIMLLYWITSLPWVYRKLFTDFRKMMIMPYMGAVKMKER